MRLVLGHGNKHVKLVVDLPLRIFEEFNQFFTIKLKPLNSRNSQQELFCSEGVWGGLQL